MQVCFWNIFSFTFLKYNSQFAYFSGYIDRLTPAGFVNLINMAGGYGCAGSSSDAGSSSGIVTPIVPTEFEFWHARVRREEQKRKTINLIDRLIQFIDNYKKKTN